MARSGCLSRLRKGCLTVFAVALVTVGGAYWWVDREFRAAGENLDRDLAALRKMGVATEPEDLAKLTHVPDADNAAPAYRRAIELKNAMGEGAFRTAVDVLLGREPALAASRKETPPPNPRAALAALDPIVRAVEEGARKPGCDWDRHWGKGAALVLPELVEMKAFAHILCAKARLQAGDGKVREAFESLRLAQRIGGHTASEPTLIGGLVGIIIDAIVLRAWQDVLEPRRADPAVIRSARETLEAFMPPPDLRRAMGGEIVLGRSTIQVLKSMRDLQADLGGTEPSAGRSIVDQLPRLSLFRRGFEGKFVAAYRGLLDRWPQNPLDVRAHHENFARLDRAALEDQSFSGALNQVMFPVLTNAADAYVRDVAARRVARACVWVLEKTASEGAPPASLPEDESFRDPFDGRSLRYRREARGFVIYSIGPDLKDDGGAPRWKRIDGRFDEVMAFPRDLLPPRQG